MWIKKYHVVSFEKLLILEISIFILNHCSESNSMNPSIKTRVKYTTWGQGPLFYENKSETLLFNVTLLARHVTMQVRLQHKTCLLSVNLRQNFTAGFTGTFKLWWGFTSAQNLTLTSSFNCQTSSQNLSFYFFLCRKVIDPSLCFNCF